MREGASEGHTNPGRAPDCLKCLHFRVTWDSRFPRSCEVFQIKSLDLPSRVVYQATGWHCPSFEKNPKLRK